MTKTYGMPYMGSKSKIAERIIEALPSADCFVDLFGGGGAMTECACHSGKYKTVIYNELDKLVFDGFKMAINGEFKNENRWIDHESFQKNKDHDPYAAICFSFGNNMKTYAYTPEDERFKKHLHRMFFAKTPQESRLHWKGFINEFAKIKEEIQELTECSIDLCKENGVEPIYDAFGQLDAMQTKEVIFKQISRKIRTYLCDALKASGKSEAYVDKYLGTNGMAGHYFGASQWLLPTSEKYTKMQEILPLLDTPWDELDSQFQKIKKLECLKRAQNQKNLERLENLDRLERLKRLEALENKCNLELFNLSYEHVEIPENSVIYCDIPYHNTEEYRLEFDHKAFYQWAHTHSKTIYISEYQMPEEFIEIARFEKTCSMGTHNNTKTIEKLYCNKA